MATAMITGGTSGIGAAFARALAARGDNLVLVARDAERLATVAAELEAGHGVRVETLAADLADRGDVDRVLARLTDPERPVDTLVNNAGFGVRARLTSEDHAEHDRAFEVMVRAVLVLGGAAGRVMRGRGGGTIINVGSTAGFLAMGSYSAIKAWVTACTEGLATELAGTGVQVTVLLPGWVRTEFHERAEIGTRSIPEALWLDADELVAACLADAARHKVWSMPSKRYQVLMFAVRHAPRGAVRFASRKLSSGRH